jgi:glycosyltransferase involved in cell wall biosynthesis
MKNDRQTLVILSPGFPENEADSTCLPFLQNFITELNTQFPLLNIEVLAFDYPFISTTYLWKNNTVHSFNGYKKNRLKKLLKWLAIWKKLNDLKKKENIIGILSLWCGECAYIGDKYAKRNRIKHFSWILGQDAKKENHYINRIKPSAETLIAISDFVQTEFEKNHGTTPLHTIPLGIAIDTFTTEKHKRDIDILGVGSLIPLKQYDLFIEIIHHLKTYFPNIKAVLCGKGPEEEKLLQLVEKYSLQQNIILTGELLHGEILQQMKRSKILLHPSQYEGFSAVCMEALYAGTTVVSFCRAMKKEIPNWYIVNTKAAMFTKVLALLNDPSLENISVTAFIIQDTAKQIMHLYDHKEAATA